MAHGNKKRKASEGVRYSKCQKSEKLRSYLEDQAKSLVASDVPVLSILRQLDGLAKRYESESQGRR